jgi:hypothetical protein
MVKQKEPRNLMWLQRIGKIGAEFCIVAPDGTKTKKVVEIKYFDELRDMLKQIERQIKQYKFLNELYKGYNIAKAEAGCDNNELDWEDEDEDSQKYYLSSDSITAFFPAAESYYDITETVQAAYRLVRPDETIDWDSERSMHWWKTRDRAEAVHFQVWFYETYLKDYLTNFPKQLPTYDESQPEEHVQ